MPSNFFQGCIVASLLASRTDPQTSDICLNITNEILPNLKSVNRQPTSRRPRRPLSTEINFRYHKITCFNSLFWCLRFPHSDYSFHGRFRRKKIIVLLSIIGTTSSLNSIFVTAIRFGICFVLFAQQRIIKVAARYSLKPLKSDRLLKFSSFGNFP